MQLLLKLIESLLIAALVKINEVFINFNKICSCICVIYKVTKQAP